MFSKQEIRKEMLEKRRQLTQEEVEAGGLQLLDHLQTGGYLQGINTAFVYVSGKNEVSTFSLISHLLATGVHVCVPKTFGQGHMEAWQISDLQADLKPGAFGLLEPVTECPVAIEQIDLVIVPGVAFDKNGNRIGYGGGYYDRFLQKQSIAKKVGVCYQFQLVDAIASDDTDVAMDVVVAV